MFGIKNLGSVYTDAVSFVAASVSMRLRLSFTRPMKTHRFENAPLLKAFLERPGSDSELDRRRVNEGRGRVGTGAVANETTSVYRVPKVLSGDSLLLMRNFSCQIVVIGEFYLQNLGKEQLRLYKSIKERKWRAATDTDKFWTTTLPSFHTFVRRVRGQMLFQPRQISHARTFHRP